MKGESRKNLESENFPQHLKKRLSQAFNLSPLTEKPGFNRTLSEDFMDNLFKNQIKNVLESGDESKIQTKVETILKAEDPNQLCLLIKCVLLHEREDIANKILDKIADKKCIEANLEVDSSRYSVYL